MEKNELQSIKWLRILIYIAIVSIVNTLLSYLPLIPWKITNLISLAIVAVMVISLLRLGTVNRRYRKAAIFRCGFLTCLVVTSYLTTSTIISLAASVLSILAVYQEYAAHAELIGEHDGSLSGKWHSLFIWSIAASVLISVTSMATVLLILFVDMADGTAAFISGVVIALLNLIQCIINVVYITYLNRMIQYFDKQEL